MKFVKDPVRNLWHDFYKANLNSISEKVQSRVVFLNFELIHFYEGFDNYFSFDGSCEEGLKLVHDDLFFHHKKTEIKLINSVKKAGKTIFYTRAEGYCSGPIFELIHKLIDTFKLKGEITFCNSSLNNVEMYEKYCAETKSKSKINNFLYYNTFLSGRKETDIYNKPEDKVKECKLADKKLYTCLNWSPWEHRLALINLLHYNDLLDQGYVSSPSLEKLKTQPEKDFARLAGGTSSFFRDDPELPLMLSKLVKLRNKYPLTIDERNLYKDVDDSLNDLKKKSPVYNARLNAIFELITETLYSGEHFFSEKTFIPISMGKPFLLVCGYNSLDGLKKLGFKTFHPYIDESYDLEKDPKLRLKLVVKELKRLSDLRLSSHKEFNSVIKKLHEITKFNQEKFNNHEYIDLPV